MVAGKYRAMLNLRPDARQQIDTTDPGWAQY